MHVTIFVLQSTNNSKIVTSKSTIIDPINNVVFTILPSDIVKPKM